MPNDLQGYLKAVPTDDNTRADAWDAYNNAKDQNDFQGRVAKLNIPDNAKADLWDAKYNGKALNTPPPAQVAQASNPSPQKPGLLSRVWDWAQQPVNVGHLRESLDQAKADSESAPSVADSEHPLITAARKGVEGFGADAGKMLLTPLSLGLAAAGPVAEGAGKAALAAKVALTGAGVGFGVHGAADVVSNPTPMAGESTSDYIRRVGGDAAMITGGAAGVGKEAPAIAKNVDALRNGRNPAGVPIAPGSSIPATPAVDQALDRKAAAIGTSVTPETRTVYVDPKIADALDAHKTNPNLSGKRVVVTKTNKIRLANTDPDVKGFQYNDFKDGEGNLTANNTATDDRQNPNQVPVTLSTASADGKRATSAPGHYLDWQVDRGTPSAAPEAPAAEAPVVPQPESPAMPPEATEPVLAPPPPPQPVENKPVIRDKVVVPAEPTKGIQEVKLPVQEGGVTPGLLSKIEFNQTVKRFDSLSPEEIQEASQMSGQELNQKFEESQSKVQDLMRQSKPISDPELSKAQQQASLYHQLELREALDKTKLPEPVPINEAAPPVPPTARPSSVDEELLKPMLGNLMRAGQLRVGELASHAIDIGMRETRDPNGSIPPEVRDTLSKMLGNEPVGENLHPGQMVKLEQMRGAMRGTEPQIKNYSQKQFERLTSEGTHQTTPEQESEMFDRSQTRALEILHDPDVTQSLKDRITTLAQSGKPFKLSQPENEPYLTYPQAKPLDPAHPEAEFAPNALGHEITPITMRNLEATTGKRPWNKFLGNAANPERYLDKGDLAKLAALKEGAVNPEVADKYSEGDLLGVQSGMSVLHPDMATHAGSEAAEFERSLQQKALNNYQAQTLGAAKGLIGKIKQAGGPSPELQAQLDALSPSVKRHLPGELFNEKSLATEGPGTSQASGTKESATPAAKTTKPKAGPTAGKPTPYEGITTTGLEDHLLKNYPDKVTAAQIDLIQKGVAEMRDVKARQKMYKATLTTLANAVKNDDDFALLKGIDASRVQEGGDTRSAGLGFNPGGDLRPYTPEENFAINHQAASNILTRWEDMSLAEIMKKKGGLYGSLQQIIDGSAPTSLDPEERLAQTEAHNEVVARHDALKEIVGKSDSLWDSMTELVRNVTGKGVNSEAGRVARQTIRETGGEYDRNQAIIHNTLAKLDKFMGELPIPEQSRFWDFMERGQDQAPFSQEHLDKWAADNDGHILDPNEVASTLRRVSDAARERVTATSGNLQNFIVNYMPNLWDNVAAARNFTDNWAGNKSLSGNSDFLKQKFYEYRTDGLKAGLQPTTTNPVRAVMLSTQQLDRYSMAHDIKNRLLSQGIATHFQAEETPPTGWERLDDKLFQQGNGGYWAPSSVARNFNNFVSTGLRGKWQIPYTNLSLFDGLKALNGTANQMQLGLSFFHGMETIANSAFSASATGIKQLVNEGNWGAGVANLLKGMSLAVPVAEDYVHGSRMLINYRDPEAQTRYLAFTHDLETARANVNPDPRFRIQQIEKFKQNYDTAADNLVDGPKRVIAGVKASLNLMKAGVETAAWPLMNHLIPRVKLGAFYRMAEQIHSEYEGQPPDTINREIQKAWNSIDNRFGEVNYANLFMNKTVQDLANLSVRSLGWTIGTALEGGGGVVDAAHSVAEAGRGNGLKISNRTAYVGAMVLGTMQVNAIYNYIHTGQMPTGASWFFPKDGTNTAQGEANRVYPKTYVYDFINLYHDPLSTVEHKAAPGISTMFDMIHNEDYYHKLIRDPGDSLPGQAASTLGYMAHQFVPFSFSNASESNLRGSTSKWESYSGILPAPRWVGRTPAENLAYQYYVGTKPSSGQSPAMLDKQRAFVQLRNKVASGQVSDEEIQKALDSGKLSLSAVQHLYDSNKKPQIAVWSQQIRDPDQLWNVWNKANPNEKRLLFQTVLKNTIKNPGPGQEQRIQSLQDFADQGLDIPMEEDQEHPQ